ncbi:MAG: DUF4124 domain-containing protein [Burkholderiales bacterium]
MRARRALVLVLALAALPAGAQLYRQRDPETGRTKLTNVPPPGARGAPSGAAPAAASAAPAGPGATLPANVFEADRQRARLLQQLVAEASAVAAPAGKERFLATLGELIGLETRLDKLDPGGRKGRVAERDRALERCAEGFAAAFKDPTAQLEFSGEVLRFMGERVVQCARAPC